MVFKSPPPSSPAVGLFVVMGEEKHCLGGGKAPECVTWTLPVQQTPGQSSLQGVPLNFFNFLDDMDSPQKHYRLTGKLLENRVPTFISICGLSPSAMGLKLSLSISGLNSILCFPLPSPTQATSTSTLHRLFPSAQMLLPSSRDTYMCPLNSQEAPFLQKAFPPSIPPLSTGSNGSKHMGSPETPCHYVGLCSSPFALLSGVLILVLFLAFFCLLMNQLGDWVPRDSHLSDDNRLRGSSAEQLQQMKPRPKRC